MADPGLVTAPSSRVGEPHWAHRPATKAIRSVILAGVFKPLLKAQLKITVEGADVLEGIARPVLFAANHCSHVDTPLILLALPADWRRQTAVAAASDYFFTSKLMGATTSLVFGTFPVDRSGATRNAGAATEMLATKTNVVVFPEGTRSVDGKMGPFRHGAARLAMHARIPVVPIGLVGTHEAMPKGNRWIKRGRPEVKVKFGSPLIAEGNDIGRTFSLRIRNQIAEMVEPR